MYLCSERGKPAPAISNLNKKLSCDHSSPGQEQCEETGGEKKLAARSTWDALATVIKAPDGTQAPAGAEFLSNSVGYDICDNIYSCN